MRATCSAMALLALLALCLVLAPTAASAAAAPLPRHLRGVHPKDSALYQGQTFTCRDGSLTIPAEQINDDYCDCADGSDEPGTGACANSQFYCRNLGASGKVLPSSRVNDGLCDCCDGSDETEGLSPVRCENTCYEEGRAAREAALAELASIEAGLQARAKIVAESAAALEKQRAKLARYETLLTERRALLEALRAEKAAQEAQEAAERQRREAEQQEEADALAAMAEAEASQEQTSEQAEQAQPAEASVSAPDSPDAPAAPAEEEKKENFPFPAEYAYDPAKAAAAEAEQQKEEEAPKENFPFPAEYAYRAADDADAAAEDEAQHQQGDQDDGMVDAQYTDEEGEAEAEDEEDEGPYISQAAEEARAAYETVEKKLNRLQKKYDDLKSELSRDYGQHNQFAHLATQCFQLQERQYTYEVCPYQRASQKEGHSSTSLGSFASMQREEAGEYVMAFTGGQGCWQGPQRSLRVHFTCGSDESLQRVEEPSKCVYEMWMQTPAVCDEQHAADIKRQIEEATGGAEHPPRDEL